VTKSRKLSTILLVFLLILGLIFVFIKSPPRSWSDSEPPGWPNRQPESSLSGMISASNRLGFEVWVTPPVYARAVAYASAAYWDAYRATSEKNSVFIHIEQGEPASSAGSAAYSRVFSTLIPTPATERFRLMYDSDEQRAVLAADAALLAASRDGYSNETNSYKDLLEDSGIYDADGKSIWLPVYNSGTIAEPYWGSLTTIMEESNSCKSPPPLYSEEFLAKEGEIFTNNYKNLQENSLYTTYVSLFNAYAPSASGLFMHNVSFSLYSILVNLLEDSGVHGIKADKVLLDYAIAAHDTYIVVYRDKYKYKVPAIQNFHSAMTMHVPHSPSYPALPTALTSLLVEISLKSGLDANPRLEVPGSMPTPPWNRVIHSVSDLTTEIETVFYVAGYGYRQDMIQGALVGECIFTTLSKNGY